jgi:hypothetical protein
MTHAIRASYRMDTAQLNRSPHCISGHEGRVTPHHFYLTQVAQIVSTCVNVPAYTNSRKRRLFQLGRRIGTEHEIII